MAATRTTKLVATIAGIVPVLIIAWLISDLFLPVWRWQNVDWAKMARELKMSEEQVRQPRLATLTWRPRGEKDPVPWQLINLSPPWGEGEEDRLLVRCSLISERTGTPPSALHTGSGHRRDRFFTAKVWRFPNGSFGLNAYRPVLVYDAWSFDKCDVTAAEGWMGTIFTPEWSNDDEAVEDGFHGSAGQD